MKHTLVVFSIVLSLILTPFEGIHAATPIANTALIQQLLAQIQILQAELNKLRGITTTSCTFTRTLYMGTQGTDVTCLQTYLKTKGHFTVTATGFYGPLTKAAVYAWQQSVGIIPEPKAIGMFGPRSQEAMMREMQTTSIPLTPTPTTPTPILGEDTTPPSIPTNLSATLVSKTGVTLTWSASTDNIKVERYRVYLDGTEIGTTRTTTYTATNLAPNTTYLFAVSARDGEGNSSGKSLTVRVKTLVATSTIVTVTSHTTTTTSSTPTPTTTSTGTSDTLSPTVMAQNAIQNVPAGTRSATLSVTTNENATCRYGTIANTAYGSLTSTFSTTGGTSHSVLISGLTDGSTKKFYVRCGDSSNNVTTSDSVLSVVVATASAVPPSVPTYQTCSAVSPSNAHSHFDSLKNRSGTLRAWALRSDAEIQANGQGRYVESHAYDTQFDGDKLTFNTGSMNSIRQLELPLGRSVGEGVDNSVSVQWEMRFDGSWDDLQGLSNHKAIRLDDDNKIGSTDGRYIELQHRYGNTADGAVALPTIRTYATTNGGLGSRDPIATNIPNPIAGEGDQDWQPGGQTKAPYRINYGPQHHVQGLYNTFVILPERWVRTTMTLRFDSGEARLIVTMSDEQTDPVVIIDDPVEPGKGFMVDRASGPSMIDNIQVEFNSSQEVIFPAPKYAWVRNFVAAVNTDLPHGGRPITSTCAGVATRLPTNAPLTGGKTQEEFLRSLMEQLKAIQRELDVLK